MIKKTTRTIFAKECYNCPNRNICLSGNRLSRDKRMFLLSLLHKQPKTKAMIIGEEQHKEKQKGIKTIEEYGITKFYKDLYSGKRIILKELRICGKSVGLRGIVDMISIQYEKGTFNIFIWEFKRKINKNNLYQFYTYVKILSDRLCRVIYKKKVRKEHLLSKPLYLQRDIVFNISGVIEPYNGKPFEIIAMVDNQYKSGFIFELNRRIREYRSLMPSQAIEPSEIPPCKICHEKKCYFWKFCKKYDNSNKKIKQRYLGKKKIIIKTKPKFY